jgi:hypothetical protein
LKVFLLIEFCLGMRCSEGEGKGVFKDGIYEGHWKDGLPDGEGTRPTNYTHPNNIRQTLFTTTNKGKRTNK